MTYLQSLYETSGPKPKTRLQQQYESRERSAIPPGREREFESWVHQNRVTDLDNPDSHYDYRGAFMAGVNRGADDHWPDTFKQHGHPTFSVESEYSRGPKDGGTWNGDEFIPGKTRLQDQYEKSRTAKAMFSDAPSTGEDPNTPLRLGSPEARAAKDIGKTVGQGAVGAVEGAATLPADLAVGMPRAAARTGKLIKDVLIDAKTPMDALRNSKDFLAEPEAKILDPIHSVARKVGDLAVGEPQGKAEKAARETVGPLLGQALIGKLAGKAFRKAPEVEAPKVELPKPVTPKVEPPKPDEPIVSEAEIAAPRVESPAPVAKGGKPEPITHRSLAADAVAGEDDGKLADSFVLGIGYGSTKAGQEFHLPMAEARYRELQSRGYDDEQILKLFAERQTANGARPDYIQQILDRAGKVMRRETTRQATPALPPPEIAIGTKSPSDAGTLYSGINPKHLAKRAVSTAGLVGTGYGLSQSDNPELEATGKGIMALAVLHGIGAKRFARAGRSVGRTLVDKLPTSVVEKINPDALLTPEVRTAIHQYEKDVAFSKARAKEMGGKARALGPAGDRKVSDVIEGENFEAPLDPQMTEKVLATAAQITEEFTRQGRAKVKAGLLPEEAVAKREGAYLPRKYAEHEVSDAGSGMPSGTSAKKMRIGPEYSRKDLTPEQRNKLGEIREASYRTEQGIEKGGKDLAAARLFETLRASPDAMHPDFVNASDALKAATDPATKLQAQQALKALRDAHSSTAGEWVTLPDTRGLGPLRGAVVRREVANSINGIPEIGGAGGSLLRYWKRVHTVYNPGTHVGNFFSNVSLAHLAGLPAWEQPLALARAAKELRVYGPNARALTEAGVLDANIATVTAEGAGQVGKTARTKLRELAGTTRPETQGKLAEKGITPMSGAEGLARKADQKVGKLYNNEDNVFRVALYRKAVTRAEQGGLGMAPKDAAEYVRRNIIDYRTRSPLLNWMRNTVSPFVLFPAKALPLVASQIVEHPWRWITLSATWGALDQYSQQKVGRIPDEDLAPRDKRSPVGYLMPGTTQLPAESPTGDKYAFDVSRFTPLSAVTTGGPPGSTGTALSPNLPSGVQPSGPLVDLMARFALNTDPFSGEKFIRPSDNATDIAEKATVGKVGPGAFTPGALSGLALPSALSYHIPKVATDLQNADPDAAKIDAAGIIGLRPKVIRPGAESQRTEYGYHREAEDIRSQMRQDLRKAKSKEARISIFEQAKKKQRSLMQRYEQHRAEAGR